MDVTIHYEPRIEWQTKRIDDFVTGLQALGMKPVVTGSRDRVSEAPAVLFGTTFWREIEAAEGDWLLVDRASFGDPDFVSLVWNGHGRRGDHKVPADFDDSRWLKYGPTVGDPQHGSKTVLCGQTEAYSPVWTLEGFYSEFESRATHFRPHPAMGGNPTRLPSYSGFEDVELFITLNTSFAVDALIRGHRVEVHDEGGMAYDVDELGRDFLPWLAWTQWSWDEIRQGHPIAHHFQAWL